uniref:G-protein coupled receptors family 1 profile domain-containing protein n=1 Tax=Ascaris lumbricoides TaxID=6252 RepID=A0A9J2PWR6_ASCLU
MNEDTCARLVYAFENVTEYVIAVLGDRCPAITIVIPTVIIYALILILGVFGNICTCAVIARNSSMHNPTNYYLFSLAISDLLILIMGLPMELHDVLHSAYPYRFGSFVCKLRAFLVEFTSYASILTISAFTVERWVAICFPLKLRAFLSLDRVFKVIGIAWAIAFAAALPMAFIVKVNRIALPIEDNVDQSWSRLLRAFLSLDRVFKVIGIAWAIAFAAALPMAFIVKVNRIALPIEDNVDQSWSRLVSNDGVTIMNTDFCAMDITRPGAQKILIYFAFSVFFLLPAVLITVGYCHIGIQLRSADKYLSQTEQRNLGKTTRAKKSVIRILGSRIHLIHNFECFAGCCYYSNSACNPILYNILSEKYRRAFLKTIFGKCKFLMKYAKANKVKLFAPIY